jgi:quinol---cytochrome c reductase cytochrome c subunit, bacillus type
VAELPEHLQRRAAEARAKAQGTPVDGGGNGQGGNGSAAPGTTETVIVADGPGRDLDAESARFSVPKALLQRAMYGRAKADGTAVPQLVGAGVSAGAASASAPSPGAATTTAAPPAPSGPPPGVRTQRLLTVVKAGAIQGTTKEPTDKVNVWPHLLAIEFVALLAMLAFLTLLSAFVDAPLLEFANFNEQPNPSKAPWYFLGLQELLAYFDPMVAGVIIPTFGMLALVFVPYVDRNPSTRPSDRKLAISIFTVFFMAAAILTIFGSFFRGPGFNFTFPWRDGIFFDDLLTILE